MAVDYGEIKPILADLDEKAERNENVKEESKKQTLETLAENKKREAQAALNKEKDKAAKKISETIDKVVDSAAKSINNTAKEIEDLTKPKAFDGLKIAWEAVKVELNKIAFTLVKQIEDIELEIADLDSSKRVPELIEKEINVLAEGIKTKQLLDSGLEKQSLDIMINTVKPLIQPVKIICSFVPEQADLSKSLESVNKTLTDIKSLITSNVSPKELAKKVIDKYNGIEVDDESTNSIGCGVATNYTDGNTLKEPKYPKGGTRPIILVDKNGVRDENLFTARAAYNDLIKSWYAGEVPDEYMEKSIIIPLSNLPPAHQEYYKAYLHSKSVAIVEEALDKAIPDKKKAKPEKPETEDDTFEEEDSPIEEDEDDAITMESLKNKLTPEFKQAVARLCDALQSLAINFNTVMINLIFKLLTCILKVILKIIKLSSFGAISLPWPLNQLDVICSNVPKVLTFTPTLPDSVVKPILKTVDEKVNQSKIMKEDSPNPELLDIDTEPVNEAEYTIEWYDKDGKLLKELLTETGGYFDPAEIPEVEVPFDIKYPTKIEFEGHSFTNNIKVTGNIKTEFAYWPSPGETGAKWVVNADTIAIQSRNIKTSDIKLDNEAIIGIDRNSLYKKIAEDTGFDLA